LHKLAAVVRNCGHARALAGLLIIDPGLVHPAARFERLDLDHQSNIGHAGQKRQQRSLSRGSQWETEGEAHETS
jgi:hypothetical protein